MLMNLHRSLQKQKVPLRNIVVFSEILEDFLFKAALLKLEKLISAISKQSIGFYYSSEFQITMVQDQIEFSVAQPLLSFN